MTPTLYRYRDSESVIKPMDGYTPPEGWEPLYSQSWIDKLQAQLVRQKASYEAEIKIEIDSALERAAQVCDEYFADLGGTWDRQQDAASRCAKAIRALKESKE